MPRETFQTVLTAAIKELSETGFTSAERVSYWQRRLKEAAEASLTSQTQLDEMLRRSMATIYKRLVDNGGALQMHPGVSRFTLDKLRPQLRNELNRRIMASADLIKLNRERSIATTLSRFSGWASSIPSGGSEVVAKAEEKAHIRKALASLPYADRRCAIDQGHKLIASINQVIAIDGQALGGFWHSKFRQPGYNYRPDHKERDGKFYLFRGTWAQERGLIKPGPDGYYDQITAVAEEPFCGCSLSFAYHLRQLPPDCLTVKGVAELKRARELVAAV